MYYSIGLLFAFIVGVSVGWQQCKKHMLKKLQDDWKNRNGIFDEENE